MYRFFSKWYLWFFVIFESAFTLPVFRDSALNRLEASNQCRSTNENLPGNEASYVFLRDNMARNGVSSSWLDIHPKNWGTNHYLWLDGSEFEENLSSPQYKGPPKDCGILETTYSTIDDAVCSEKGIGYICELNSGSNCASLSLSPYECVTVDERSFLVYERTSSWFMARQLCQVKGGLLAQLKSETMKRKISVAVNKHHSDTKKYFIGFRSKDYYRREDQNDMLVEVQHWYPGEPSSGDCVIVQNYPEEGYFWKTVSCTETHRFLCVETQLDSSTRSSPVALTNTKEISLKPLSSKSTLVPTEPSYRIVETKLCRSLAEIQTVNKVILVAIIITLFLLNVVICCRLTMNPLNRWYMDSRYPQGSKKGNRDEERTPIN